MDNYRSIKIIVFTLCLFFLLVTCSKEKKSNKAGLKMQEFVASIARYARAYNQNFIVIPQNGIDLAYKNLDISKGLDPIYMQAINGVGVEELFYNKELVIDAFRLDLASNLPATKKVLVADFLGNNNQRSNANKLANDRNFIAYPRLPNNYDYQYIQDSIVNENAYDINTLTDAKNFLYLISTTNYSNKNNFLNAIAATNYDVVLIDLFFADEQLIASDIQKIKVKANGGKRLVIAYMNIGAAERYRYYWKSTWGLNRPLWIKKKYEGYSDEYWVKFWKNAWQEIIYGNENSYTKKIIDAGFDGTYLDNVEAYYFLYYDE